MSVPGANTCPMSACQPEPVCNHNSPSHFQSKFRNVQNQDQSRTTNAATSDPSTATNPINYLCIHGTSYFVSSKIHRHFIITIKFRNVLRVKLINETDNHFLLAISLSTRSTNSSAALLLLHFTTNYFSIEHESPNNFRS